tara:strand:- start:1299 stop:1979 length:681 start_codon:yes stop_codon:yes gene_type:complete
MSIRAANNSLKKEAEEWKESIESSATIEDKVWLIGHLKDFVETIEGSDASIEVKFNVLIELKRRLLNPSVWKVNGRVNEKIQTEIFQLVDHLIACELESLEDEYMSDNEHDGIAKESDSDFFTHFDQSEFGSEDALDMEGHYSHSSFDDEPLFQAPSESRYDEMVSESRNVDSGREQSAASSSKALQRKRKELDSQLSKSRFFERDTKLGGHPKPTTAQKKRRKSG